VEGEEEEEGEEEGEEEEEEKEESYLEKQVKKAPIKKCGKLGTQRKHINHTNKYVPFVRCTYTYTCDVCSKALGVSMQPNDLLHTP